MSMIDLRYIKKLIEMLDGSSVDSVEISSEKGVKLRVSKSPQGRQAIPVATPVSVPAVMPTQGIPMNVTPAEPMPAVPEPAAAPQEPKKPNLLEVKSPMVGTYYSAPEPDAKPYVTAGTRVAKGQVLCIIEAMKIMNEIESEFSGVVREVCVDNSQPVEFGQVLYRIDPNA